MIYEEAFRTVLRAAFKEELNWARNAIANNEAGIKIFTEEISVNWADGNAL